MLCVDMRRRSMWLISEKSHFQENTFNEKSFQNFVLWPAKSTDLFGLVFFLSGFPEKYRNNRQTLIELKKGIMEKVRNILSVTYAWNILSVLFMKYSVNNVCMKVIRAATSEMRPIGRGIMVETFASRIKTSNLAGILVSMKVIRSIENEAKCCLQEMEYHLKGINFK